MKLSRVEIHGFKSFAQRTELNFDKGITGIVGPNGSGKSNIADAVRWVLGEQSAKMLRGTKMEDVIFNGTQTKKALPYCEVSLQFDNEDLALNSNYTEVLVTRRVYRNGEGEYFLNKNNCRLRDIVELFRDTGIGKEGYSIIGQGRIEEILSTKSEERREVFEEAAGIVTFRVRKEEAERKLNRTKDNLNRVNDLIEEIGGRLEPLKSQAKIAQEYISLSERLRHLEVNIYLIRHDKLQTRLSSLKELTLGLQNTIRSYEHKLNELNLLRNSYEELLGNLEIEDRLSRKLLDRAQEDHYKTEQKFQAEQNRLENLELDEQRLSNQLKSDQEKMKSMIQVLTQSEHTGTTHAIQQREAEDDLKNDEKLLADLLFNSDAAEKNLDKHKEKIITALTRMSDFKSIQTRQQTMLAQMQERKIALGLQCNVLLEQKNNLNLLTDNAKDSLDKSETLLSDLIGEESAVKSKENLVRQLFGTALKKLEEENSRFQAAQNRLTLLEDLSKEYEGYHHAVKKALQYASGISGVYGIVAQLINVPKEYETAIDMILGGALQNIITDNEQTAKTLIDYLRENKLGRTTFLPISAIKGRTLNREEKQFLNQPGCIGIASDLINFKPDFAGIIDSLLGRTVLVRDMDAGINLSRIARQSFNVVTLSGDVLRSGGAMTGGTSQSKASSLLGRKREIEELRFSISKFQSDLVQMKNEKETLDIELADIIRVRAENIESVNQQRIALARQQERYEHSQKELHAAEKQLDELRIAINQLDEAITETSKDLNVFALKNEHENIDQKSLDDETNRLQNLLFTARKQTESQREKLADSQLLYTNLNHQYELVSRDKSRAEKEINLLSENTKRIIMETDQVKAYILASQATIETLKTTLLLSSKVFTDAQEQWEDISRRRSQVQTQQKLSIVDWEKMHALIDQDNEKLHRNELVYSRTENEIQNMNDYLFNTYELTYALAQNQRSDKKIDLPQTEAEIKEIKQHMKEMGNINAGAIEEYNLTRERFEQMTEQKNDAQKAEQDLTNLINQLLSKMEIQFVEEFKKLNEFFSETFRRLFDGGKAELILTDIAAPLSCEIEVAAQPPGKKLQMLSLLSGGERALTAIAILFAMLKLKPTPFCILDEIEAALDETNIVHFSHYLAEYAQSTQFIIITHRKGTMECCDALYGVAMEEKGISSMVSVNLQQYTVS